MIKATTPTSQGWAQAFDSSGIAQALVADKERKRKRFDDNLESFSSDQIWHRDLPEFNKKVNNYYNFMSENYEAAANPARNPDVWREQQMMENNLHNFSVQSKMMGQQVDKAQKLMYDKPSLYNNPENQDLIDSILTGRKYGGLAAGYASNEAMNSSFMKEFNQNIILDTQEMTDFLKDFGAEDTENVETFPIDETMKGRKYPITYDDEGVSGTIEGWWKGGFTKSGRSVSGTDIQRKFGGDYGAFAETLTRQLPKYTKAEEYRLKTDKDDGEINYQWFTQKAPSGIGIIGQHETTVVTPGSLLRKEKTDTYKDPYVFNPASRGNVNVGGTKAVFRRSAGASGGYNLRDNIWSTTNLTDDNLSQLTNVDEGFLAESPIHFDEITMKDDQGKDVKLKNYTVPKGGSLSDEMVAAIDAGNASYVDESGVKQPLMRDVNVTDHVWQGRVAYSRNTSYASGFDIKNPLSYMNSLTAKQYRSMAEKWEDYKQDVRMHPKQVAEIESQLDSYGATDHYGTSEAITSDGELDFDLLDKDSQAAANRN